MIYLPHSLAAWNSDVFSAVAKREIGALDEKLLPLQQGLRYSSSVNANSLSVTLLHVEDDAHKITVRAGLFYTGIISGCNCADDPTPIDEYNEYCEVVFQIDKKTAMTSVLLID